MIPLERVIFSGRKFFDVFLEKQVKKNKDIGIYSAMLSATRLFFVVLPCAACRLLENTRF